MNIILIISDSFRWDHLGFNGIKKIHTPALDKFASQSNVFNNAYFSSFPTIPNRWDVLTGRLNYTYATWQAMDPEERILPEILGKADYTSMLIVDTPHMMQHGFNFQKGFSGFEWIRGQENDHWKTSPREVKFPCSRDKLRSPDVVMKQYLRNVANMKNEEDHFAPRTMSAACEWLRKNHDQGDFFLHIDTFDPHEPWDPPHKYVELYDPNYTGEEIIYPRCCPSNHYTQEEVKHMAALYAGEVTMVDTWVGKVLDTVEELGLTKNTAVIFMSDHGFMHGEHGVLGKSLIFDHLRKDSNQSDPFKGYYYESVPFYEPLSHIPLLIRMPGQKERKNIDAWVQPIDLMPTILEIAGIDADTFDHVHGHSLLPLIRGKQEKIRDLMVSVYPLKAQTPRMSKASIRFKEWNLFYCGKITDKKNEMSVPDAKCGNKPGDYHIGDNVAMLFDLNNDPGQINNVIADNLDIAKDIHARYVDFLIEKNTPDDLLHGHREFTLKP
jgi:arylsulfatase A-like enzyme